MRRFFDFRGRPPVPRERAGMGSGFIFSSDGFVITNHHVVDGAKHVVVRLPTRQEFDAEIIGTDPRSDLAVLKIAGDSLPILRLADDGAVKVGSGCWRSAHPLGWIFQLPLALSAQ